MILTIENTGEKLTPQLVSTLDEPFLRGTERIRTDHASVGLGLAIAKSITQAHDGTLSLTPRAAGGLRVTVQLPAHHRTLAADIRDRGPGIASPSWETSLTWSASPFCADSRTRSALCLHLLASRPELATLEK